MNEISRDRTENEIRKGKLVVFQKGHCRRCELEDQGYCRCGCVPCGLAREEARKEVSMGAYYTEEWLADYESRRGRQSRTNLATVGDVAPKRTHDQASSPRKNRFAENAGELGVKIAAHKEQINGRIRLWLPYPPSTNNRMALVKGRMLKSAEARSYQKVIKESLVGLTPLTGDLEVVMQINRPRRRGDIDNVLKNCFDALTGVAFLDDDQIATLEAKRNDGYYARKYPGIQIQISTIV